MAHASPLDPDQLVTASDLVRRFGLWQDRAARAPLYILHHGRPRFVLTSVETMGALCAASDSGRDTPDVNALLDTTSDLVVLADDAGRINATSRAARAHFGKFAANGARLDAVARASARDMFAETIRRVTQSGTPERFEIASVRGGRLLAATLAPIERGLALVARDGAAEREHAHVLAARDALGQAMTAAGGTATAMLSAQGRIMDPGPALAALTGLACEALATIPFDALADPASSEKLAAAVARVLGEGRSDVLDLTLLVHGGTPIAVRIGLAPIRTGDTVDGAIAVLVQRDALPASG